MPMTQTVTPDYPDVPQTPGVPPVLRRAGEVENAVVQIIADAAQVVSMFNAFGPQWGIFDQNGQPVLRADSVISVDYRNEWRIATHPIERGAFQSYNKVKQPFDVRVVFAVSGQQSLLQSLIPGGAILSVLGNNQQTARRESLAMIDRAIATTELVSVLTPEATYPSVNIVHYDYRREARSGGVSLIRVEVWLQEVRVSAEPAFSKGGELTGTTPTGGDNTAPESTTNTGGTGNANQPSNGGANAPKQPEGASPASGGTVQGEGVKGATTDVGTGTTGGGTVSGNTQTGGEPAGAPSSTGRVAIDVTASHSVPPGSVPMYKGGNYIGYMPAGRAVPAGITIGPVAN